MLNKGPQSRTSDYPYCVAIATLAILAATGRASAEPAIEIVQLEAASADPYRSTGSAPSVVSASQTDHPEVVATGAAGAAAHNAVSAPNKPNDEAEKGPPCTWTPGVPPGLPTCVRIQFNLGLAWWLVEDKGIFGPSMRIGSRWVSGQLEWSLIRLWHESPHLKSQWLGSIFGFYLSLSPIHTRRWEAHLGLGGELHWLHGIHSEELKPALGAKTSIHWMFDRHAGVFGSARTYLATGEGLGLGENFAGTRSLPIVFSFGFEFRTTNDEDASAAR